jgi:hypothetical protein
MHSVSRWPAGSALLLGGGFIVVACAKEGPGDTPLGLATENGSFAAAVDGGGTNEASGSGSSGGNSGSGLNTPPPATTGDDSSGGGGGQVTEACNPNTCASGCCANGACASGTDDTACGQSGSACTDCTATMQVCSFGSCIMGNGNGSSSSGGSTDPSTGPGGRTPPMSPLMSASTSCGGKTCTNACFPLGLPCCTSAGSCGCIALYFLPCN